MSLILIVICSLFSPLKGESFSASLRVLAQICNIDISAAVDASDLDGSPTGDPVVAE